MAYQLPCPGAPVSDTWHGHKNRQPPSSEPGTDYACAYGTALKCAGAGYVEDLKTTNGAATGRYVTVQLDDSRTVRYLHLSSCAVSRGQRVSRGQVLGYSGASANGSDWGVGAHVHVTLWPGQIWAAPTIDFERYAGDEAPAPTEEGDAMTKNAGVFYTRSTDQATVYLLFNPGSGWHMEYLGSTVPGGNNAMAAALDTGSYVSVTEAFANSLKASLNDVDPNATVTVPELAQLEGSASSAQLVAPAWVGVGLLLVIAVAQLVGAIVGS